MCAPITLSAPMVSRYNLRTDFKFCTVVGYHKMQIKFEFQCDQIIGSKVVSLKRTHTHQTKRRVSHNTSPLTKSSAELEIKVDVKYVGEDERTYRFPNFYIFKQFPFQILYNLDHFFQFSITFNNSFLPFQFPYPSIFATCYPFPEIFTSFPFPPNRANSPFYPSVRSSSPTYFTSTFISNSADGLVYPSTLSGDVLCDKNGEIRKSKYARITNTRFVDPLFENFAYIKKNHICSLLFNKIMFI
jgi:hypothetical protein